MNTHLVCNNSIHSFWNRLCYRFQLQWYRLCCQELYIAVVLRTWNARLDSGWGSRVYPPAEHHSPHRLFCTLPCSWHGAIWGWVTEAKKGNICHVTVTPALRCHVQVRWLMFDDQTWPHQQQPTTNFKFHPLTHWQLRRQGVQSLYHWLTGHLPWQCTMANDHLLLATLCTSPVVDLLAAPLYRFLVANLGAASTTSYWVMGQLP